jgi:hypothetical protein
MKFSIPTNLLVLLCAVFLLSAVPASNSEIKHVDIAFCVDMSASTNGVLNDVRNRIWTIANGILNKNEETQLRIAVVGYGRPSFGSSDGFVKVLSGLTNDFDRELYGLFQLRAMIDKGDQFVPNALFQTFKELKWSKEPGADRMVFLMGNGSVRTGSINLADLCEEYKKNNIRINTIFISQSRNVMSQMAGYKGVANETGGQFYIMEAAERQGGDKNVQVPRPVLGMNDSLNKTFMFYSQDAADRQKFLFETDNNVLKSGSRYFYSRMLYKTSKHYTEGYEPYDLTAYMLKYNKMPERMNLDFLSKSENTMNISEIEKRARQRGADRIRLNEEIKNMFTSVNQNVAPCDTLLDNFLLGSYR